MRSDDGRDIDEIPSATSRVPEKLGARTFAALSHRNSPRAMKKLSDCDGSEAQSTDGESDE